MHHCAAADNQIFFQTNIFSSLFGKVSISVNMDHILGVIQFTTYMYEQNAEMLVYFLHWQLVSFTVTNTFDGVTFLV